MATVFKWATLRAAASALTTELNALANAGFSAAGTAIDNATNLDEWAQCEIILSSLTPTAGATLTLYMVCSLDGTNYEDAPSSTNPGTHMAVATVALNAVVGAKRLVTPQFQIPPCKFKLVLQNNANVALGATGNTVTISTGTEQGV
jgi:hypothetical protein